MDGLAKCFDSYSVRLLVTSFGMVRISEETDRALEKEIPGWPHVRDRRTKAYRRLRQLEDDINAIALSEWIHGGNLVEF